MSWAGSYRAWLWSLRLSLTPIARGTVVQGQSFWCVLDLHYRYSIFWKQDITASKNNYSKNTVAWFNVSGERNHSIFRYKCQGHVWHVPWKQIRFRGLKLKEEVTQEASEVLALLFWLSQWPSGEEMMGLTCGHQWESRRNTQKWPACEHCVHTDQSLQRS